MAGHTIGQPGQHDRVVPGPHTVTIQAPAHIHFLRCGNGHLADFAMAILAVDPGCNMWAVAEENKIRQDCHRNPDDGCGIFYKTCQFVRIGVGFAGLLVAAIT